MKNAIKLFMMDVKKVAKTPGALVLIAGLAILPSFYAWFNLEATWDPYSNTDQIKIAVVNEDEGDVVKDKKINVGNKIEETLRKDDHFDWRFMSREKADQDLRMGKYYAAIYIPKAFTHEITGTLRKDPQQAKVTYKVNQKLNAIAPKMTDAGTSEIVKKANDNFNETVTKVLLDQADQLGIKLEDQIPAYEKIRDGVFAADQALPKIERFRRAIIYADDNQDKIDNYANEFRNLENYKDEAISATERLNQINASIPAINERAELIVDLNRYMPDIERALQVASGVPNRFPAINDGVDLAVAGTEKGLQDLNAANERLPLVKERLNAYGEVIDRAQSTNQDIANSIQNASTDNHVQTAPQSSPSHQYQTTQLSTANDSNLQPLPDGQVMSEEDANAMTAAYAKALTSVNDTAASQIEATQSDIEAAKTLSFGIMSSNQPDEFKQPLTHLIARMNHASKSLRDYRDFLSQVEQTEGIDLSKAQQKLKNTQEDLTTVTKRLNALNDAIAGGNSGKSEAADVIHALSDVQERLNSAQTTVETDIQNALLNVSDAVGKALNKGATTIDTAQAKLQDVERIIRTGQRVLTEGNERLTRLREVLPSIEATYVDAMSIAQSNFPKFKENVARASDFVQNDLPKLESRLNNATNTVNQNLPELFAKYDRLREILDENQPRAKASLSQLADFARNQMPNVEKDIQKANDIFTELDKNNTLQDMIDFLRNDLKKQAGVIANPIDIQKEDVFPVKDYGSASTPFYTALAIWVGALLLVSLLTVHNKHETLKPYLTIRETYLGKMGIFLAMNMIQAFIVSVGDIVILKASVESVPLFIALCVYSAMIFMTIVYTLVSLLGNPGKALAIIILVLQIAGGGGTFPIEVTPAFFQAIHPFLPFSYSIDALREAVGGPVPEILTYKVLTLGLFGVGFFLLGIIGKPYIGPLAQTLADKAEKSDILE